MIQGLGNHHRLYLCALPAEAHSALVMMGMPTGKIPSQLQAGSTSSHHCLLFTGHYQMQVVISTALKMHILLFHVNFFGAVVIF
jgi:hypothetical protein